LTDFFVESFRDLRSVELPNLEQVNLIVGGNNSGKTSVLEAIAIALSPVDVVDWSSTARSREVRSTFPHGDALNALDAIKWMFPHDPQRGLDRPDRIALHMRGDWIVDKLVAHCTLVRGIPPEELFSSTSRRSQRSREGTFDMEETGLHLEISADLNRSSKNNFEPSLFDPESQVLYNDVFLWPSVGLTQKRRAPPRLRKMLLGPYSHRNQPLLLQSLSRLTEMGLKDRLIGLLVSIDPDLLDFDIITSEPFGKPTLLVERRNAGFVPISVLGDGFRRALSIALAMVEARAGVLLIDEIETAFHVSVLDRVFPWMNEIARDLDVQIFATTHSLEAIQAMSNDRAFKGSQSLAAFHLSSDGPARRMSKRYSLDMLRRLVRDRGLDIR
jgi:hypothetical protein